MTETHLIEIERVRSEAARHLAEHEIACERRYKGSGLYLLIVVEGLLIAEALPRIWDPETQALFAAVMSFWFGNRTLSKLRERR